MPYLPLPGTEVVKVLNLPTDTASNPLWAEHASIVMGMIAMYASAEALADALEYEVPEDGTVESEYYSALRVCYSYFMFAITIDLLNIKTAGEGISKSVAGVNGVAELLNNYDTDAMSKKFEYKALLALGENLSIAGKNRLNELSPRPPRLIRVGLI